MSKSQIQVKILYFFKKKDNQDFKNFKKSLKTNPRKLQDNIIKQVTLYILYMF